MLQFLPFNTLYQLAADPLVGTADQALLIPDLIGYWLTGRTATERTNASTTGLLDVRTQDWDIDLAQRLGLPGDLFPGLVSAGHVLGPVRAEVGDATGLPGLRVTSVGSHDTASAVVGVPMSGDDAAYISCGTWGLVGVELAKPLVTQESRTANFTNEGGVDGRVRFLTNVMGTWLLSETVRGWEAVGERIDLAELLEAAAADTRPVAIFDVQDPRFLPPGDMPTRISAWCAEHGVEVPQGPARLVRSIVLSLAAGFARAVDRPPACLVVGAPRFTWSAEASRTQCSTRQSRTCASGPSSLDGDLEEMTALIARTHELSTYRPGPPARSIDP